MKGQSGLAPFYNLDNYTKYGIIQLNRNSMKTAIFIGSSQKDIREFPEEVKEDIGYALYRIQQAATPESVKRLKGLGSGVLEVIEDFDGGAYRAVYTIKFEEAVYVLHCFQKKSKQGSETPPRDLELIRQRLKMAEEHHKADFGRKSEGKSK